MSEPKKRKGRALLVASVGVAITTFGCDPPAHVGNLRPVDVVLPDAGPAVTPAVDAAAPAIDAEVHKLGHK